MRDGFSLLEVLVALVIASISLTAIAHSAWTVLLGQRQTELLEAASVIAERSLEELLARGATALGEQSSADRVSDPRGEFERRTVVEIGPRENLWHLIVMVTPPHGGAPVRFHTLVRRPRSSP